MRKVLLIGCVVVLFGAVSVAVAGDKHCTASTQECLNKMVAKIQQKGWLGVETDKAGNGRWQVTKVYPDSPAAKAGFEAGDVLVSMNGVEMTADNKEALKKAKHAMGPGSDVTYVVKRQGGKVKLHAQLDHVPDAVVAEWVGKHMVADHSTTKLASK
jgi:predicted metalloprotease with PDZ domain